MSAEHRTLQDLESEASAYGEIHSITTDSIEIRGNFTPGQSLVVRPGARVFILTADDAIVFLDGYFADAVDGAVEDAIAAEREAVHRRAKDVKKAKRGAAK